MSNVTEPTGAINQVSLGENSFVQVGSGAITLAIIRGTVREAPNPIPTVTNASGGFSSRTRGPRDLVFDFEMFWVPSLNPLSNSPNFEPGTYQNIMSIYPDFEWGDNNFFYLPVFYIQSNTTTLQGDGVQTYTGTITNEGLYYSPQRTT